MPADLQRARALFLHAVGNLPPERWEGYIVEACGPDAELAQQVKHFLQVHREAGSFLELPAAELVATSDLAPEFCSRNLVETAGTLIGHYKLLEQIGEGGFGVVFMALQQQPIRRTVALKVLKPGMDTRQVIARFEAERQALALMDHANIAKVLDAGQTTSGRPYFVMDLVKGYPITDFCDKDRLTPRQRLELFMSVCLAVQHAHQKGIIHRDIKPSNVLVTRQDGTPLVKVIDFGIAKALGQQLTDKTLVTGFAQMVGTPLYMAPEQAALSNTDVDTRSDVYSLGVVLYELLTGTTPFDKKRLHEVEYDELRRIIREEEPPKPSTRISTLGQTATPVSLQRNSDPRRLRQFCRGDLDWIVMKALEKDRNRRYETASAFAADVQRYLQDEPVLACPPSAGYLLRKFIRRKQRALATAVLLLAAVAGVAGSLAWQVRDWAARQQQTERGVLEASAQAETHLGEGDKLMDHPVRWQMTVALADASARRGAELLTTGASTPDLAERVRRVREAVEAARRDSDLLVALDGILLETAAIKQGHFDSARAAPRYAALLRDYGVDIAAPAEAAARVRDSRLREWLLAALDDWRRVTRDAQDIKRLEAVQQAAAPADSFRQHWLAVSRRGDGAPLAQLAGELAVQKLPVMAILNMARDLEHAKQMPEAERLLRAWQQRYPGNFWLNHDLGMVLYSGNPPRAEEAVRYLTAALALRSDSPGVHVNLSLALLDKKDPEGAIRACQAALQIERNYAGAHLNLGNALLAKKDVEGSIRAYRTALEIDPNLALAHYNLGNALLAKKDLEGAIRAYRAALKIDPNLAPAHNNLGSALHRRKELDGAIREYETALQLDADFAGAHNNLGKVLHEKRDLDGAIREFHAALKIDPNYVEAHNNLGTALYDRKDLDGAVREYHAALKIDRNSALTHCNLGLALFDRKDVAGAIREYQAALKIEPNFALAHYGLGNTLSEKKDLEGAIRAYHAALKIDPDLSPAHNNLGAALRENGDLEGAIREYKAAINSDANNAEAHYNLGVALDDKKDLEGAIRSYQAALKIDPTYAEAHCNLGFAFMNLGRFTEALGALQTGHKVGGQRPDWPRDSSAGWVRQVEQLIELDGKLVKVLSKGSRPANTSERLQFAFFCRKFKQRYATAAAWYTEAFAAEPKAADDLKAGHRYQAACAAALAGAGQGHDAGEFTPEQRAGLRKQALDWLRADLAVHARRLQEANPQDRTLMLLQLEHWQRESDLTSIRDPAALAKLPAGERAACVQLWTDVDTLLRTSRGAKKQ